MAGVSLVSGRQVDSRVELLDGWDAGNYKYKGNRLLDFIHRPDFQ
jgi:hypothetical protein